MEKILTEDANIFLIQVCFFFLSEHCNERSASFKILLLFFFSDDDSLFMYDCSAAEKKSQEHKG